MTYSDEPQLVSENRRSSKRWIWIGLVGLLLATLAAVAFYPKYFDYKRRHAEVGPNEGTLYSISIKGERFSMELARPEELDLRLHVFLKPVAEGVDWSPENFVVRVRPAGKEEVEWEKLTWAPESRAFGPSEWQFNPVGDYHFDLEILRGEERVWRGARWSYRVTHGHAH